MKKFPEPDTNYYGYSDGYNDNASRIELDALIEKAVSHQGVELTWKLSSIVVDNLIATFEFVDFLEYGDGDYDVVFLKGVDTAVIV